MVKLWRPALLFSSLAACQEIPPAEPPGAASSDMPGLEFAQATCGGCHAVGRYGRSPNPKSPPFPTIANRQGLSAQTLSTWLRDAHNYPEEMKVRLEPEQVDALVAYMLTLQDPNYRPPID